jgi:hypothetical protein
MKQFIKEIKQRGGRQEKEKIRHLTSSTLCEYFLKHEFKRVRFLTLPGVWWHFEKKVSERFRGIRTHFTGCEINRKFFELSVLKMPHSNKNVKVKWTDELECEIVTNGNNCILFHSDVFNVIEKIERSYECIWLDLSSPISEELIRKIKLVELRLNERAASFILTVLGAREGDFATQDNIKKYGSRSKYIVDGIESMLPDFKLLYQWEYRDISPMVHTIFIRREDGRSHEF